MKEYHKINTLFKRNMAGDKKLIIGDWSTPEFEYLQNNEWEFTEKVDGTNIRVHFDRVEDSLFTFFGGRTDRADIPPSLLDELNRIFLDEGRQQEIGAMMVAHDLDAITFYGEGYGPKIQGGGKYRDTPGFVLFDIGVSHWWLDRAGIEDIASNIGLDVVPVIGHASLNEAVNLCSRGGFKSTWGDFIAEGIVARPRVPMFTRKGDRIIAKIKTVDFQ